MSETDWLDEIRVAIEEMDQRLSPEEVEFRIAEGDRAREYIEGGRHLQQVVAPVLLDAAEYLKKLGWNASAFISGVDPLAGEDSLTHALVLRRPPHQWTLSFQVRMGSPGIAGSIGQMERSDLTEAALQGEVRRWVVAVVRREMPSDG